jgi:DNA-binding XRE family transcriptional regulator
VTTAIAITRVSPTNRQTRCAVAVCVRLDKSGLIHDALNGHPSPGGLTQSEVAELDGVTRETLRRPERDAARSSRSTGGALAAAVAVHLESLTAAA